VSRRQAASLALAITLSAVVSLGCSGGSSSTAAGSQASRSSPRFVLDQDFPDPDVLRVGDIYYAYATNTAAVNVQVATSPDLNTWTVSDADALPTLPSWAVPGKTWAPEVSEFSPGRYVMYFTTANASPALQCIGVATATGPAGPFEPVGNGPIVCPADGGGAIDPSTFVDTDGSRYLVWKNDGNCCALDTWLQVAPLSADGFQLAGTTTKLVKQSASWEGSVVEAPVLVKHGSKYVLFYSANNYADHSYAIGYATASSVTGPYLKRGRPLLSTKSAHGRYVGPGGQDVVAAPDGSDRIVFHSWDPALAYRGMNTLRLTWSDDEPLVAP